VRGAPAGQRPWTITRGYRLLIVLPAAFLAVFFITPIAAVIVRGFTDPELGLQNYAHVANTGLYVKVLYNTIETAALVTVLALIIAYPLAYAVAHARGLALQCMAAIVIIPLWTSVVIRSYAWMVVFQRKGVLNEALVDLGVFEKPMHFIPGTIAVNVGMVHIMLPFMVLPLIANMRAIDGSLVRAAGVLGASPWASFRKVFFPLSIPGISAGSALVFMMSLGFFITPALLGGPKHLMAAVLIEQQANRFLNWGLASALSTILLILTLAIYAVYVRLTRAGGGLYHGG
jgi:putative spermidine/putrescine transport system permease protein/mannopine transport system permease protein